ncbi:MAG: carboxypeptidase regulatory-like domain-containing protein [Anaerolineae bacterium]
MLSNGYPTGEYGETYFYVIGGPVSVSIRADRSPNGVYQIGDPIRIYFTISRPVYVRIYDCQPGLSCRVIAQNTANGGNYYLDATITAPTGWEKVRIEAVEDNQIKASAEDWFYVTQPVSTQPPAGMCRVTWVSTNSSCSGEFGLASPQRRVIFSNYQSAPAQRSVDIGPFDPSTSLTFYIRPTGYCPNNEYLSTSANARIQQLGTNNWRINWEDLPPSSTDSDYNDLVTDIQCGIPVPQPDAKVSRSLTFLPNPANVNDQVTGSFSIHNYGNATWNAYQVCIAGVPNGGGPPCDYNVSIAPGQTRDFSQRQSFSSPGTYNFEVNWQDSSQYWHQVPADNGVSRTGSVTVNQPTYTISGTVRDETGAVVGGATVAALGSTTHYVSTGSDGRYTFTDLPADTYRIGATKPGYDNTPDRYVSVPPSQYGIDFTINRTKYSISGRVTDDAGAPIEGATVAALGSTTHYASTGSDGRYAFTDLLADTYRMGAGKPGYGNTPDRNITVPPNQGGIDFTLNRQDDAQFVGQSANPSVPLGQSFQIYFELRNSGTTPWRQSDNYYLANLQNPLGANARQEVGGDVLPGNVKRFTINVSAPTSVGTYRTQWMLKHNNTTFGPNMYLDVTAVNPCTPGTDGVILYEQPNYGGRCITLTEDTPALTTFNDMASSIKFVGTYAHTWEAVVYPDANYGGASSAFHVDDPDFGNDTIGQGHASSVRIHKIPIILLPGIQASRLANAPRSQLGCFGRVKGEIWLNEGLLQAAVPEIPDYILHRPTLAIAMYNENIKSLFLQDDGKSPADPCDQIVASDVISRTNFLIPQFDTIPYAEFIQIMQDYQIEYFPYDWRLSIDDAAFKLDQKISDVKRKYNASTVVLIGHSMGGLVARRYTMSESRARNVARVITVGTPYWGAPKAAWSMRTGLSGIGLLDLILDQTAVRKLVRNSPGGLALLPSEKDYFDPPDSPVGGYYATDHGRLTSFQQTLDFFVTKGGNRGLLEQARDFHRQIDDFSVDVHTPYQILAADHIGTTIGFVTESPCAFPPFNTCWLQWPVWGDGTVPRSSSELIGQSQLDANVQICNYGPGTVVYDHAELLRDISVIQDIRSILAGRQLQFCQPVNATKINSSVSSMMEIVVWGEGLVRVEDGAGHVTGFAADETYRSEIPEASFHMAGSSTIIVLPTNGRYTLTIQQTGSTPAQVRVARLQSSSSADAFEPQSEAVFLDVPFRLGGLATLNFDFTGGLDSLRLVDRPGSGTPDVTLAPTLVLDPQQSQDYSLPTTTINVQGTRTSQGYYTGNVSVTLSATDSGTGVLKTEYSLDGGQTWQTYSGPVRVVAERARVFTARSVDRAGNQEYPWVTQRLAPEVPKVYLPYLEINSR